MNERDGREIIALCLPLLKGLLERFVFTGGCVVGLIVDQPVIVDPRATDDADAIVDVLGMGHYGALQESLIGEDGNLTWVCPVVFTKAR